METAILASLAPPPWQLGKCNALKGVTSPTHVWNRFVNGMVLDPSLLASIEKELSSSMEWQSKGLDYSTLFHI